MDAQTLVEELIYILNGFESSIFELEDKFWHKLPLNAYFTKLFENYELRQMQQVGLIAVKHAKIQKYLDTESDCLASAYQTQLHNGIRQMLSKFHQTISELESKLEYLTLSSFAELQKFDLLLSDIVDFIEQIANLTFIEIFGIIHRRLDSVYPILGQEYQRCLKHYKLPFYENTWNWCVLGKLDLHNHFFVKELDNLQNVEIDKDNIPSFLSSESISRIHLSGKLIRFFSQKYDDLKDMKKEYFDLCNCDDFHVHKLSNFIENVSSKVFKFSYFYLINNAKLLNYVELIKNIHLMGNQSFWLNLIEDLLLIKSQRGVFDHEFWNKKFLKCWKRNLMDFYNEHVYEEHFKTIQVKSVEIFTWKRNNQLIKSDKIDDEDVVIPCFSFAYDLPELITMVLNEHLFEKYDIVFNFCFRLCQAKSILCKCWKISMRRQNKSALDFVRFRLMIILEHIFYFYKANVIERLYGKFVEDSEKLQDIFTMELCHHNFVLNLISESFLDNDRIKETLQAMFCFCFKLYKKFQNENALDVDEADGLEREINDLYIKLYYLLSRTHRFESKPYLSQLIFQIGKILKPDENKLKSTRI